jgi:hypothetical protein
MRLELVGIVGLMAICAVSSADAFGTISGLGQNREHERITRHALGCGQELAPADCFESNSLDEIAGKPGSWGAVGAPDDPARGLLLSSSSHCDNGDWVDMSGYPRRREDAQEALLTCRSAMNAHLDDAVRDARRLLRADGEIDDAQIPTFLSCTFLGQKGRAKCDVIESLGLVLHASQDFYAHSNWVDHAARGSVTLDNPTGLDHAGPSPWLDLRHEQPFPDGLITGCFDSKSLVSPQKGCQGHIKHEDLNKDKGTIDPVIGSGTTNRGRIDDNFRRAVEAAIADTRDKWAIFRERLVSVYGVRAAGRMICTITRDRPTVRCASN